MQQSLSILFTDQSPSFVHGVELGRLLEKMERGDAHIENNKFPVHEANKQVIIDTCKAKGYTYCFSECDAAGWINFFAIKRNTSDN